jgi:hypothetical protein
MKALRYSYVGRKQKKRIFRKIWISRINAASRLNGISYSQLIHKLKQSNIDINRKILSQIAVLDALNIQQAHCFGASIGAAMCFILAKFYPDRFKSYIFATPYFELFNEDIRSALNVNMQSFIDVVEVLIEGKIDTRVRGSILANDPQALSAANSSEWFNYLDYT